ncbi:MAG TPA: hypothetical protein PLT68_04215 [Actinomycetota bacterium]|nr:hypothetical protein [Actinomycetota bacterium]
MDVTWAQLMPAVREEGLEAHWAEVRALLQVARSRRVAPLLCDVASDASAPDQVRARALDLIIRDLVE